ncbi:uncharacterized protein [Cardiocondyla obscurior]|uniref:uncharacterized protein n=1 Tax=Cardiocondyla obscurior TaxID=286306 RepID=UPI00396566B9
MVFDSSHSTLLATALAKLNSPTTQHTVRLLIDSGSELTFMSEHLVKQLRIQRQHSTVSILGIGGSQSTHTKEIVELKLCATHTSATKLTLADPDFLMPRSVDIILGADYYGQVIKPNIIRYSPVTPIAQLSIFGWLVLGPVCAFSSKHFTSCHAIIQRQEDELQDLLTKFWTQEEVPTSSTEQLTPEEQIPLCSSLKELGDSYVNAHQCFQRLLKRLSKDLEYHQQYRQFLEEYQRLNHMVKAPANSQRNQCYYMPHHGVLRPESTTTKLRVVFNGSSKTSSDRFLNDIMHTGAKLQLDVPDVLF